MTDSIDDAEARTAWKGVVKGRVQGVFFRAETQQMAKKLGIDGWVRNTLEGDVEVLISGRVSAIEEMRAWLQEGPSMARVDGLELVECPVAESSGFDIRY